tara:strand:+ start:64 stop:288 length:225 start_codon:yes stop_codon:yes gene_type:complete
MEDNKGRDFVTFHNRRKVINLCKNFLVLVEDLKINDKSIPPEDFQKIRKRVLDYGNDTIREFEENLENFDITFK